MYRPQQYPNASLQPIPHQSSLSPPLPGSPKAYPVSLQDPRNAPLLDPRAQSPNHFQQYPQVRQHPSFPAPSYLPSHGQGISYLQQPQVNLINGPVYGNKPSSPVYQAANQNRVYYSQSVHVSPKNGAFNNNFQQQTGYQNIQQSGVHFNYTGGPPLQISHVRPLPEPVSQMIPAQPQELDNVNQNGLNAVFVQQQQNGYVQNAQNVQHIPGQVEGQGYVQHTVVREIVWERRFVEIYTKFEIFVEKFEVMIEEVYIIEEQFDSVSDEDGWNELRGRYADLMNKFNQVREDIITVLEDNKKAIESLNPEILEEMQAGEETGSRQEEEEADKGQNSSDNVWQHRYYELMQQHDVLSQEYGQIREEYENLTAQRQADQNNNRKDGDVSLRPSGNNKVAELENNLNTLHTEYQQLGQNYNKLEEAYSQALSQLQQQNQEWNQQQAQKMIENLEEEAHNAYQKVQYLEEQLRKALQHKSSSPNDQHFNVYESRIEELLEEKNILIKNMNQMKNELEQYDEELNRRQKILESQSQRIYELEEHIENSKKMDVMGEDSLKQELHNAIETIRENERSLDEYRKVLQERERVLEDIARNRDDIARENEEFFNRIQDNERDLMERQELVERLQRKIKLLGEENQDQNKDDRMDTGLFTERVKIEVESAVNQRNRKIRSLTQELEDANAQVEKMQLDKQKSIAKIKEYFSQEEDRKDKMLHEKDNNIRILSDKIRSLEHELSSRNLEISRFRHQSSTSAFAEDSRKLNEHVEKKNNEIQKIRRSYQQKCLEAKELQQKLGSVQHELSIKVFEINALKRESYQYHGAKAEIESQNSIIKKKNQEINELRLKVIENEQMHINITSLEREKVRLNQILKERARQLENKDASISTLEKKINSLRMEIGSTVPTISKSIDGFGAYDSSLVKQKQTQIRRLKNDLEIKEATISTLQKTNKEKESKISTQQKTNNMLKAEIQNKINRYETEIKTLQKELKESRNSKEDKEMTIDSMKSKMVSLQNSLEERNVMYDHEIALSKQKIQSVEQTNTNLLIEKEMAKTVIERAEKQNRNLQEKINNLQEKLESKTKFINDLKVTFSKKEKEDSKGYQDRIKQLDGEIKLDTVKIKNMEELIQQLSNKLKEVETEKRSYRERLLTETSGDREMEFRFMTEYNETMPNIEIYEMDRFKIKDPESNNVFERRVIYELKKENDILRKELSGAGYSSVSLNNRFDTQNQLSIYQQEFATEQNRHDDDHHAEVLLYHKNINKDLQQRIDGLLTVNRELKEKVAELTRASNNQSSMQFYKDQVSQLESEIVHLKKKVKELTEDRKSNNSEIEDYRNQLKIMINKNADLQKQINELKSAIRLLQTSNAQAENTKAIQDAQISRLKQMLSKEKKNAGQHLQNDKIYSQSQLRCDSLQQEVVKLTNRIEIMKAEAERLNEVLRNQNEALAAVNQRHEEELWELKRTIQERETQIQALKMNQQAEDPELLYKLELLRSLYMELESLIGEIMLKSQPEQNIASAIIDNINQGLALIPTLATR